MCGAPFFLLTPEGRGTPASSTAAMPLKGKSFPVLPPSLSLIPFVVRNGRLQGFRFCTLHNHAALPYLDGQSLTTGPTGRGPAASSAVGQDPFYFSYVDERLYLYLATAFLGTQGIWDLRLEVFFSGSSYFRLVRVSRLP